MQVTRKDGKLERRRKELLKAQCKSSMRFEYAPAIISENSAKPKANLENPVKRDSQRLDISVIKMDLLKTALYIAFTLAVLYLLKTYPLQFNLGIYK